MPTSIAPSLIRSTVYRPLDKRLSQRKLDEKGLRLGGAEVDEHNHSDLEHAHPKQYPAAATRVVPWLLRCARTALSGGRVSVGE